MADLIGRRQPSSSAAVVAASVRPEPQWRKGGVVEEDPLHQDSASEGEDSASSSSSSISSSDEREPLHNRTTSSSQQSSAGPGSLSTNQPGNPSYSTRKGMSASPISFSSYYSNYNRYILASLYTFVMIYIVHTTFFIQDRNYTFRLIALDPYSPHTLLP